MKNAEYNDSEFAGTHIIADFWDVQLVVGVESLEDAIELAVTEAGAVLLNIKFHQFPGQGGITGYALLAESHISIHTWPERQYIALDIFMCGRKRIEKALQVFKDAFNPAFVNTKTIQRGQRNEVSNDLYGNFSNVEQSCDTHTRR